MMDHWAAKYVGMEWQFGGRNPQEGFDCYGLFKYIQLTHYGLDLPDIEMGEQSVSGYMSSFKEFEDNNGLENWLEVDTPEDGDAVLMRIAKYPHHVGVWIVDGDNQGVLHAIKAGVIFSSKISLNVSGWKIVKYYRHKNGKNSKHSNQSQSF